MKAWLEEIKTWRKMKAVQEWIESKMGDNKDGQREMKAQMTSLASWIDVNEE
jgi:hypothetical protein